jgi:hypothetical protein
VLPLRFISEIIKSIFSSVMLSISKSLLSEYDDISNTIEFLKIAFNPK